MAEAALLCWLAPPARSLAGQVTAVAPLAVFHDLRWMYGYDRSWLGFAGLLVAILGARSGLNTALARLAWPRDRPVPGLRELFRSATGLTIVACLLLMVLVEVGSRQLIVGVRYFGLRSRTATSPTASRAITSVDDAAAPNLNQE